VNFWRRDKTAVPSPDPEPIIKRAREVEIKLRTVLGLVRERLDELEEVIHQPHDEEV